MCPHTVLSTTLAHLQQEQQGGRRGVAFTPQAAAAAAPLTFPRSHTTELDPDPVAARQLGLSAKEVDFFKENVSRLLPPSKQSPPLLLLPLCCRYSY